VYFGVATRVGKNGVVGGGSAHCGVFNALFADFDFKENPEAAVRMTLTASPLPPSIVVQSGGGLHCYWLLKEPISAAEAAPWLRRLALTLKADPAATDAARI